MAYQLVDLSYHELLLILEQQLDWQSHWTVTLMLMMPLFFV